MLWFNIIMGRSGGRGPLTARRTPRMDAPHRTLALLCLLCLAAGALAGARTQPKPKRAQARPDPPPMVRAGLKNIGRIVGGTEAPRGR